MLIDQEQADLVAEAIEASEDLSLFCTKYGHVESGDGSWERFTLWPDQVKVCDLFDEHRLAVALKARQLGLTWIACHEAIQTMLFKPGSKIGLFSLREKEAQAMLRRMKFIFKRLPKHLKPPMGRESYGIDIDAAGEFELSNGSNAKAFSTNSGDSYTFDLVIFDEADLVPDLGRSLRSVKPTIDGGGRLRLISRSNKSLPDSDFKKIYRAAKKGENGYAHIFLPWYSRTDRTREWYEQQKRESMANTGSLDFVAEQYPTTDVEALAPNSLDKRLPYEWLAKCYQEKAPLDIADAPAINGLHIWKIPEPSRRYVLGIDPAEGNPTSDESAIVVGDLLTGEQVAEYAGRVQPEQLAHVAIAISVYYGNAWMLCERNNHGHAVQVVFNNEPNVKFLLGPDGNPGWYETAKGKALLYSHAATEFQGGRCKIYSEETFTQLGSIEGSSLRAPSTQHDDRAIAYVLMLQAAVLAASKPWVPIKDEHNIQSPTVSKWQNLLPRQSPFMSLRIPDNNTAEVR